MMKKKSKRKIKNKKTIPLNIKSLGNKIESYPFVEITWLDIEGDAGWSNTKDLNNGQKNKKEIKKKNQKQKNYPFKYKIFRQQD